MNEKRFELPFNYSLETGLFNYVLMKGKTYRIHKKLSSVLIYEYLGDDNYGDAILTHCTSFSYSIYNTFIKDINIKIRSHIIDNILE